MRATPADATVVVLAGRRIDALDAAQRRFPPSSCDDVERALHNCFVELGATVLVCSAANGADLLALRVARELGLRTRIVIGGSIDEFRRVSVVDRPGATWGSLFDEMVTAARDRNDLVVVDDVERPSQNAEFAVVNSRLADEAVAIAAGAHAQIIGVAVWDQRSRGEGDVTAAFVNMLNARHIPVRHVSTLDPR